MNGFSARVSAVVVVVLLAGVVGLAMAGKPPKAQPAVTVSPAGPSPELVAIVTAPSAPMRAPTPAPAPTPNVMVIWDETVVLAPGATPNWDAPVPPEPPRHTILGEDGIFGLPGWPWRATDIHPAPPARKVFAWLGRYWPGPAAKITR